ncbi:hypothetical protein D9757_010820 [Collybiopsis confluens]|uniref:Fork-head domain-containing protein n=1 Tax=Collybiopsis confluens TaxID=2823264 RepID=A0A8H5GTP5_9AGAR|nr:hypothetical protein D9757_010820 [Collybiopsis confluens]
MSNWNLHMARFVAEDPSYGFDGLALKTENGSDVNDFRLFHQPNTGQGRSSGGGGGSVSPNSFSPQPLEYNPSYSSGYHGGQTGMGQQHTDGYTMSGTDDFHGNQTYPIPDSSSSSSSSVNYEGMYHNRDLDFYGRYPQPGDSQEDPSDTRGWTNPPPNPTPRSSHYRSDYNGQSYASLNYDDYSNTNSELFRTQRGYSSSSSGYGSVESIPEVAGNSFYTATIPQAQIDTNLEILRRKHNISSTEVPIDLSLLPDRDSNERPPYKHAVLAELAIAGSPDHRLPSSAIYTAIEEHFEYYRIDTSRKWRDSIRHMLTLKKRFIQIPRLLTEPGIGNYWTLDMTLKGDTRVRKRASRKARAARAPASKSADELEEEKDDDEDPASPVYASSDYVGSTTATESSLRSNTQRRSRSRASRTSPYSPPLTLSPNRPNDAHAPSPHGVQSMPDVHSMTLGAGGTQYGETQYGGTQYGGYERTEVPFGGLSTQGFYHGASTPNWPSNPMFRSSNPSNTYPISSGATGPIPRLSFPWPPMPDFPPVLSAPTHEVLGSPPESTPSPATSSSSHSHSHSHPHPLHPHPLHIRNQGGRTSGPARVIAHPPQRARRGEAPFNVKGKGRAV